MKTKDENWKKIKIKKKCKLKNIENKKILKFEKNENWIKKWKLKKLKLKKMKILNKNWKIWIKNENFWIKMKIEKKRKQKLERNENLIKKWKSKKVKIGFPFGFCLHLNRKKN